MDYIPPRRRHVEEVWLKLPTALFFVKGSISYSTFTSKQHCEQFYLKLKLRVLKLPTALFFVKGGFHVYAEFRM